MAEFARCMFLVLLTAITSTVYIAPVHASCSCADPKGYYEARNDYICDDTDPVTETLCEEPRCCVAVPSEMPSCAALGSSTRDALDQIDYLRFAGMHMELHEDATDYEFLANIDKLLAGWLSYEPLFVWGQQDLSLGNASAGLPVYPSQTGPPCPKDSPPVAGLISNFKIDLYGGKVPPSDIDSDCLFNCEEVVEPSLRVTVGALVNTTVPGIARPFTYNWTLQVMDEHRGVYVDVPDWETALIYSDSTSCTIIIKEDFLERGRDYRAVYEVATPVFNEIQINRADLLLRTNRSPAGGTCRISPASGLAVVTIFEIACSDWSPVDDADQSLHYSYFAVLENEEADDTEAILRHGVDVNRVELLLPVGDAAHGYLLDIVVYIYDSNLGYTTVNLQVETTVPDVGFLVGMDPARRLANMLPDDLDASVAMGMLISLSTVLNEANRLERTADNPTLNSSQLILRTEMRTAMANVMADITRNLQQSSAKSSDETEDIETWMQAASTLSFIASRPDELTDETMLLLLEILENVTANLVRVSLFIPRRQYIFACRDIIRSVDSLQQAAVYEKLSTAGTVTSKEWDTTRDVVTRCDRVEDDVSASMLHRLYPGEPLLRLRSSKLSLGLWKDPLFSGHGAAREPRRTRLVVDSFMLPAELVNSLDGMAGNGSHFDSLKTREYKFNPYIWGDKVGHRISSTVKTLELIDEEYQEINVTDSEVPMGILFYPGLQSSGPLPPDTNGDTVQEGPLYDPAPAAYHYVVSVQFSSGDAKFCYALHIPGADFTDEMQGNVTEGLSEAFNEATRAQHGVQDIDDEDPCVPVTELTVSEGHVGRTFDDLKDDLNATFGIIITETECVFLDGWDMSSSTILDTEQGLNLTCLFRLHSCMYWHEKNEMWQQDGCRVSSLSTANVTVCQCNHLTSFASDFVPVNTIDFMYVFYESNLGDNAAVFGVVIGIACLAVLLAPLMWWMDRRDLFRWAAHQLVDNTCEDSYMYTVSVYTGYAKHSATRSVVKFDLVGDVGETRDRTLQDIEDTLKLDTGTLNHYVMGVPRSLGPLSCMRIWHDNSGEGHYASWYLYWVVVCDLQTGLRYCFVLNDWLTVDPENNTGPCRSLSLAGREETLAVQSDFFRVVRETFADYHLWNSLFTRRLSSRFTRVQRLGVCASLLYLFMLGNAMFYSFDSLEGKLACPTLRLTIGPYTITSQQLYVGFVSSLIVFPVNFLIIGIFRRARRVPKRPALDGRLLEFPARYGQTASWLDGRALPQWSVYVAWFLVMFSVFIGGFFVVLYSLQWGKKRSEAWLISMFTSLLESVLLVEPGKTVLVAILISCCCGRFLRRTTFKNPDKYINIAGKPRKADKRADTNGRAHDSMWWQKNINAQDIVQQIGRHLVFIALVLTIMIMYRDNNAFYMSKAVNDAFLGPKPYFKKIRTFENYWDWTESVLIPTLYSNETYAGEVLTEERTLFTEGQIGLRVGIVRLRQLRVRPDLCTLSNKMVDYGIATECNQEYTPSSEDTSDHGEGWQDGSARQEGCPDSSSVCPWRFTSPPSPATSKYMGAQGTVYGGGGFMADLGATREQGHRVLRYLRETDWIDVRSRAVFIEFILYNPDANYFCLVTYLLEFPRTNGGIPTANVHTFRLYDYADKTHVYSLVVTLVHVVFLVWLAHLAFTEFEYLKKARARYFVSFNNCLEALAIVLSVFEVAVYGIRKYAVDAVSVEITAKKELHSTFRTLAFLDELYALTLGLVGFFACVKLQALLCFDRRFTVMTRTLSDAKFKLLCCAIVFFIVFYGFVWVNYLMIGSEQADYRTIMSTSETLLITLLGKFRFSQFDTNSSSKTLTIVVFVLFCIIQGFILLNMFMSIIIDSFATIREDEATYENTVYLEDVIISELARNFRKILPQRVLRKLDRNKDSSAEAHPSTLPKMPQQKLANSSPDCPSDSRDISSSPRGGDPPEQIGGPGESTERQTSGNTTKQKAGSSRNEAAKLGPGSGLPDPERLARHLEKSRRTDARMDQLEQTVDKLIQRLGVTDPEYRERLQVVRDPPMARPDHMDTETI